MARIYSTVIPLVLAFNIVNLAYSLNSRVGLSLDPHGYEQCIFNVAQYDLVPDQYSQDVIQDLIVNRPGHLRWTVFQVESRAHTGSYNQTFNDTVFLDKTPRYYKEFCSVNIIVSIKKCFKRLIGLIFGPRLFQTQNAVIILVSEQSLKCGTDSIFGNSMAISHIVEIFSILLSRDTTIQAAFSFCLCCTDNYMMQSLPLR